MGDQADGLRKSAILLLSLEREDAAEILRRLDAQEAEMLQRELDQARESDAGAVEQVLSEFCERADSREHLLEPPSPPFSSLHDAESDRVLDLLRDERPQTVALILAHLPADQAGEVLERLP